MDVWGGEWAPTRILDLFLQFDEVEEVDILEFGLSTMIVSTADAMTNY